MKPLWFGPDGRPLFGWLHVPDDGRVHGSVVLCPSLGVEAVSARYTYRSLADSLSEAGLVALRFDYDGTGDSAGQQDDPGRVGAWVESIRIAVEFVRGLGTGRVSVVGMRAGATLVAEAFGSGPASIDDLVLWDPCASGRVFLREQVALGSIALGTRSNEDGSMETPGLVYEKETATDLSAVAISKTNGPLAERILLLMRSGRKGDGRMNERLDMPNVERLSIEGQEDLVDVQPDAAVIPVETVETIVKWLEARADVRTSTTLSVDAIGRSRALVGVSADGMEIEEEALSLGPLGLFGIVTTPRRTAREVATLAGHSAFEESHEEAVNRPTVYFMNAGVLDHVGPARLWVLLSRHWAKAGFRVVRFDLTGIGDSPRRAGKPEPVVFAPDAVVDVVDVLRAVSPDDPSNAVLVGLCSGGYNAVEGAIALKVRGLYAVNPILTFKPLEEDSEAPLEFRSNGLDAPLRASGARKGWVHSLPAHKLLSFVVEHLPGAGWWVINRIAVDSPPARMLAKVIDGGTEVFVIAGREESRLLTRGEGRTIRGLWRSGRFAMKVIPELEHSLFERRGREIATELLTDRLLENFDESLRWD